MNGFYILDKRNQKMLYFLISIVLIILVYFVNIEYITTYNIFKEYKFDQSLTNISLYFVGLFVLIFIWYYVFLSSLNISTFKFKDFEISIEEAKEMEKASNKNLHNIRYLEKVINTYNDLISNMKDYVDHLEEFSDKMYLKIIRSYLFKTNMRNIYFKHYFTNQNGYRRIKRDFRLTDYEVANIISEFDNHKESCSVYYLKHIANIYFIKVHTEYTDDDIIIQFRNKPILADEHKIIQGILTVLESYVEQYEATELSDS